jgi:hypothetical protein
VVGRHVISMHWPCNVLELLLAEIHELVRQLIAYLFISRARDTDAVRLGYPFQSRRDVDAVAHEIAVGLLDNVAEMDADAELDSLLGGNPGVTLDHAALELDRTSHGVDDAAKLDEAAVPGALDGAPVMRGDGGIDEVAAQPSKTRQRPVLIRPGEPAVADHVRHQDRGDLAHLAHGEPPPPTRLA